MGKWTCKNKKWFNVFGSLVYILNEIQFYKVKKKLKPVEFCWLFLQEMRMGNIPMLSKSFTFDVLLDWKSNIKKFDIMPGTACIS